MNFAMEKHTEMRKPSADKSSVQRWILSPALLALFAGFLAAAGIGRAITADTDLQFVIGLGMFGSGSMSLITVMVKSFSFDKTGESRVVKETPILIPDDKQPKPVGGNKPILVANRNPSKVEYRGTVYVWDSHQLNLAKSRFEEENYRISRDYLGIPTRKFNDVVEIMKGNRYWRVDGTDNRYYEWTEDGEDWVNQRMRPIEARRSLPSA